MNDEELIEYIRRTIVEKEDNEINHSKRTRKKKIKNPLSLEGNFIWKEVRDDFINRNKLVCAECKKGLNRKEVQVDHILPKSKFPELIYESTNLRIICWPCNRKKAAHRTYLI